MVNNIQIGVELDLKIIKISGKWEPSAKEKEAAWEIYIELVTRIATCPLVDNTGFVRETLNSLYQLFQSTREILKKYGPDISKPVNGQDISIAYIAVAVLNFGLRPFLAKWHPIFKTFEERGSGEVSSLPIETEWKHNAEFRKELEDLQAHLREYAGYLEAALGIKSLLPASGKGGVA